MAPALDDASQVTLSVGLGARHAWAGVMADRASAARGWGFAIAKAKSQELLHSPD